MISESTIRILIYIHASFGGIALLFGGIALAVQKGGKLHKLSGKVFYYTMLISALMAICISLMPGHSSPFLFTIGVFSIYFLLTGLMALRYRQKSITLNLDRIVSIAMIITGIGMILYPIILYHKPNIVLTSFGALGLFFAIQDMLLYRNPEKLKQKWLKLHLTKMMAGYISAMTAFVVVNQFLPGIYGWLAPGLVGGFYIAFWTKKVDKGNQ